MSERTSTRRVAITQPYVPDYRVPLWGRVVDNLRNVGIEARVFHGASRQERDAIEMRNDAANPEWAELVPVRELWSPPGLPTPIYRKLPRSWKSPDLTVTEMQVSNLNGWQLFARHSKYITLGHGASETTTSGGAADYLESRLNRGASHVLTYTEAGRKAVSKLAHINETRITAFRNSTDTTNLRAALRAADETSRETFRLTHGLPTDAKIALFIGALAEYKRLDLLLAAAELVLSQDPRWWLVIVGDGPERASIDQFAEANPRVIALGRAGPTGFATAAAMASVILNPGRIGLIAVDALTIGVPILTTSAAAHAPEFEYLRDGIDVITTAPYASHLAKAWSGFPHGDYSRPENVPNIESAADAISETIAANC